MITDRFNRKIDVGDWVIYVPLSPESPRSLYYGKISKIKTTILSDMVFLEIENHQGFTQPRACIKFSEEEMLMHKLEANID